MYSTVYKPTTILYSLPVTYLLGSCCLTLHVYFCGRILRVKLLVRALGLDRLSTLADYEADIQHFQMIVICDFSVADKISHVKNVLLCLILSHTVPSTTLSS